MKISDFRSDTVTRPDEEMRRVMAEAEVGDDVFGDDPTVKKLEEKAAALFKRESALFVPSGTMANQISCYCHVQPGDEVILDEFSHIYNFEVAGLAVISRVQARPLKSQGGVLDPQKIREVIRPENVHLARTSLIALENTHNMAGGRVIPLSNLKEIRQIADDHSIKIHLDGARIFNAALASGTPLEEYGNIGDTISFCLSKGLGAPAGSLIVGDGPLVERARKVRKMLGGGMRQVGILAAAGTLALERRDLLMKDHEIAKQLAQGLAKFSALSVSPEEVETNIVMVDLEPSFDVAKLLKTLEARGVLAVQVSPSRLRFVTHRDVGEEDVDQALEVMGEVL